MLRGVWMVSDQKVITLKDGFRSRGLATTRLDAFVDAAFAFAVTLLVISVGTIPDSTQGLATAMKGIPAYAASFVMVAMFWAAHVRWRKRYGMDDMVTTLLSLSLVFFVLIYVYPLKMLFGTFFAFVSGGVLLYPTASDVLPSDVRSMFIIYAVGFMALSACVLGLYMHAWRRADALELDLGERKSTRADIATYAYFVFVGMLSMVLALVIEPSSSWRVGLPGIAYWLLALTGFVDAAAKRISDRTPAVQAAQPDE